MSSIVTLPDPPYYAVVAPATLGTDSTGYATRIAQVIDQY